MKRVILNGACMTSTETAHKYLSNKLCFPEYYGGNLDALWDCLTTVSDNVQIELVNYQKLARNLGAYSEALVKVFSDAAEENESICFKMLDNCRLDSCHDHFCSEER